MWAKFCVKWVQMNPVVLAMSYLSPSEKSVGVPLWESDWFILILHKLFLVPSACTQRQREWKYRICLWNRVETVQMNWEWRDMKCLELVSTATQWHPWLQAHGDRTSKVQRYPSTAACLEHSLPQESPFLITHVCAHMQACMYTFSPTHTPFLQNKGDGEGVRRTEAGWATLLVHFCTVLIFL